MTIAIVNVAALLFLLVSILRNSMTAYVPWFTLFAAGRAVTWCLRIAVLKNAYWWTESALLPLRALAAWEALGLLTELGVTQRERLAIGLFGLGVGGAACLPVFNLWWPADFTLPPVLNFLRQAINVICAGFLAGVLFWFKLKRYAPSRPFATEHALLLMSYFILISIMNLIPVRTEAEWHPVDAATSSATLAMWALWWAILRPRKN